MTPYLRITRPDHWFKNVFMVLGAVIAAAYRPASVGWDTGRAFLLAFAATCVVASSNYVLNELLDGPRDKLHPVKSLRPVPSGEIRPLWGYLEWLVLAAAGFGIASLVNVPVLLSALALWAMGIVYNVPPLRLKDVPYIDVLSESVNNPLRLLLGWLTFIPTLFPPVSLLVAYWMVGAFFMGTKRLAEYRHLGDAPLAAAYRSSFRWYNEERLLVSLLFYATTCALFAGIFIVRYHLELILFTPLIAGLFAFYLQLGLRANSPVQTPERLYAERGFVLYLVCSVAAFLILLHVRIPALYEWFRVEPHGVEPLWIIGADRK